jgi:hypothetical protein
MHKIQFSYFPYTTSTRIAARGKHPRLQFWRWVLTLWTPLSFWADEEVFACGVNNLDAVNVWATGSPHATGHLSFEQNFCVQVRAEIIDDNVTGPRAIKDRQGEAH